ncbi:MAG: acyl-CoA dehydrogenase family protein [Pseudomonadota bacterium]
MVDPAAVTNQPPPRRDMDLWAMDPVLSDHATAAGADAATLLSFARDLGRTEMAEAARDANRHPPELVTHDRAGRRIDLVRFHPAYHGFLQRGLAAGYAAGPWTGAKGGHATHAAMVYLQSQVEPGTACPMTMTYAVVPALDADPVIAAVWRPRILGARYDPADAPVEAKSGATIGMAMTEKQGGSDLRANMTRATPEGSLYRLIGHKWFCSAPMSDAFLTLAQTEAGLTCFLVPRWHEGERNGIRLMRLKDKLGNRSNASAEIEYHGALAHRLGAEGEGVRTIITMVHHTRLDTALAPAGLMRAALAEAVHWVTHRTVFQRRLVDQPLMRAVLADLALDWEGATALGFRVAAAFDDPAAGPLARVGVALAKFLSNKLCPVVVAEAMEVMGGMGYVEDTTLPMLYREAPLNAIWEGSGNVMALDILRTLARDAEAAPQLGHALDSATGADRRYDRALRDYRARWPRGASEPEARWFAEQTALLLTASALLAAAPGPVADAFIATRLDRDRGQIRGAHRLADTDALLARLGSSSW